MIKELELIKKKYGETFAKFCRGSFADILETEGMLYNFLTKTFAPTKFLYEDIFDMQAEFKNFVYTKLKSQSQIVDETEATETPEQLMSKAGYKLYRCHNHSQVMEFIKYYEPNEQICTFIDEDRTNKFLVFFAVKNNVDKIKRENFPHPKRQDEYGTSVISLQFEKGKQNILSIKNRYNHSVQNCDATFSNNLENICLGLTNSFKKYYNLNLTNNGPELELEGYVIANDGKYYKYNYDINNCYYCENNIVIKNGNVEYYDKSRYEVFDYFILDKVNKTLESASMKDSFIKEFQNVKKIEIIKDKETKNRTFKVTKDNSEFSFVVNKYCRINKYENLTQQIMDEYFLQYNKYLCSLNTPNLIIIDSHCLEENTELTNLLLKKVEVIGSYFMCSNKKLSLFIAPKLVEAKKMVLYCNEELKELDFPKLKSVGNYFFSHNKILNTLNMPALCEVGDLFLKNNLNLTEINFPNLKKMGSLCFHKNKKIEKIYAPNLEEVINGCFTCNNSLKELNLPSLKKSGSCFFQYNTDLEKINLPKLIEMNGYSFCYNKELETLNLPSLEIMNEHCFQENNKIKILTAPKLHTMHDFCLWYNSSLQELNAPLKVIGKNCLIYNKILNINSNEKSKTERENERVQFIKKLFYEYFENEK